MNTSIYPYNDEENKPLFRVVIDRFEDAPKRVRVESFENGTWTIGLNNTRRVVFRLPECLEAIANDTLVWVVEGEKDVLSLEQSGLVGTTNAMGAGHWTEENSQQLSGGKFAVIGDNDDAGRLHVQQVVASLIEHADTTDVRVIDLLQLDLDLPPKGDVSTFFERGGTVEMLLEAYDHAENLCTTHGKPVFPTHVFDLLPHSLRALIASAQNDTDRATLLTSTLVAIGSCFPNVGMEIDGTFYCPDLFLFIVGRAGTGKGIAKYADVVVALIQASRHATYQAELEKHKLSVSESTNSKKHSADLIPLPDRKTLIIPGDSTLPILASALAANESILISETEADTLDALLRSEYGDASPLLRSAWQHESLKHARKRENLFIVHDRPRLSLLLCGTPFQVRTLLKTTENGLVSRFLFHEIVSPSPFRDLFEKQAKPIYGAAQHFSRTVKAIHDALKIVDKDSLLVKFTGEQRKILFDYLQTNELLTEDSEALQAANRRMSIVLGRLATILSVLDAWDCNASLLTSHATISVPDNVFRVVLALSRYFNATARSVLKLIPSITLEVVGGEPPRKAMWYEMLPETFSTKQATVAGASLAIPVRTIMRYLKDSRLFERLSQGQYRKCIYGTMTQ
ncbi:MAG: DUF3987 domain-containing protein [Ignavibacteria bacterium]|nr:DUF3987 domain-containing protein [Ignavibacteria bacterium]